VCIYLYAHANPVTNVDPSGNLIGLAYGTTISIGSRGNYGATRASVYSAALLKANTLAQVLATT